MYQYENGAKKKNVGYARVEAKNGECKITLHMQLPGLLDSIFPTYLIQRKDNDMELVYLGDSILKSQVMDSKLTAEEANIMGSGYGLSDMGGILLFLNEKVFYATEWDDKPVILSEVMEALKPKPKTEEKKQPKPEEKTEAAEVLPSVGENSNPEELPEDTSVPFYQLPRGYKTYEFQHPRERQNPLNPWETVEQRLQRLREDQERNITMPKESTPEQPVGEPEMETGGTVMPTEPMTERGEEPIIELPMETIEDTIGGQPEGKPCESMEPGMPFDSQSGGSMMQPGGGMMPGGSMGQPESQPMEERENVGMPGQSRMPYSGQDRNQGMGGTGTQGNMASHNVDFVEEEKEKPENPVAAKIFESYPRIYPFEDNEITLCVKIEPKDIGYLPVDAWILSNNSFLLHGYYCYNHLIFAKMKDRFGCRYILGVPGIYHNRERFMARMFGFENFKSIRKRELRQGDFGYWYIPLAM
jgi:hypothetical protein